MKKKIIVVFGDDKISRTLFSQINFSDNIILVSDKSSNIRRVIRLIMRGSIPILAVIKMFFADVFRQNAELLTHTFSIRSNSELSDLYNEYLPSKIILFRAGLIVQRNKFPSNFDLLNIHCASIPKYGGLASIHRAIQNGDFIQNATLHRVTNKIDEGEVLSELKYEMIPSNSYKKNEDIAYKAGFKLLVKVLT